MSPLPMKAGGKQIDPAFANRFWSAYDKRGVWEIAAGPWAAFPPDAFCRSTRDFARRVGPAFQCESPSRINATY